MSKIIKFYGANAAEDPNNVLELAANNYTSLLIIGYNTDGYLDVRSTLNITKEQALWLVQLVSNKLLNGDFLHE